MRFILRAMLVGLVAFEGCKDTKKDDAGGSGGAPAGGAGGQQQAVQGGGNGNQGGGNGGGNQNNLAPNNVNKPPTNQRKSPPKPVTATVKVPIAGDTDGKTKDVTIKGLFYKKGDKSGDFEEMLKDTAANGKTLFVFNDHQAALKDYNDQLATKDASGKVTFETTKVGCVAGKGNSIVRPNRCVAEPHVAGIPIGADAVKGYTELDGADNARKQIQDAIAAIKKMVSEGEFNTVVFTQASDAANLDTGKVEVNDEVKKYIFNSLLTLEAKPKTAA